MRATLATPLPETNFFAIGSRPATPINAQVWSAYNNTDPTHNKITDFFLYFRYQANGKFYRLMNPRVWISRLSVSIIEMELGKRPYTQLRPWVTHEVYHTFRQRVEKLKETLIPGDKSIIQTGSGRICSVGDGCLGFNALEAIITIRQDGRIRPIAMRIEPQAGKWIITALEIGD